VNAVEAMTRLRSDRSKDLVGFMVGDVHYAVDILRVKEIINPLAMVALPHAPPVVVGVADHRGDVVPVIDLRRRFGLAPKEATRRTKWILVETDERRVGLVVDSVSAVFGTGPDQARSVPRLGMGDDARGLAAVYQHDGSLVFVIDVDRVAAPAEGIDMQLVQGLAQGRNP
jgi:purine-binding chemotaxis protein CheW